MRNFTHSNNGSSATLRKKLLEAVVRRAKLGHTYFRTRIRVLFAEAGLSAISYVFSLLLILGPARTDATWQVLAVTLPILLVLRTGTYVLLGLSNRSLRHASISDFICIGKAVLISSILFFLAVTSGILHVHLPPAVFILDWALLQFLLGGLQAGVSVYQTQRAFHRRTGRRVLIVGAGDAGISVVKEFASNSQSPFVPVAIIDDDPNKQRITICGIPVICGVQNLARVAREKEVEEVLVCIPSATRSQMKRILSACRECGVPVRALPSLAELVSDRVSPSDLRHVLVEDILQREDSPWEPDGFHASVNKRTALVTGAGGTIGSELARQIALARPGRLLLLDKSENSLFHIHLELKERFPELRLQTHLLDVTREETVRRLFETEKPDLVFHAAAYKHVGLLEEHPEEAIRNNVLGTRNVGLAALDSGAFVFVNISTDKAVSPSSYMGLSKRITELCIQELSRRGATRFMNVRFGNVAGSSGSVLRLFSEQIQKGGPLRVTDRDATRYFMTISEAVFLTLQAATQGQGGETFVFNMGEPIRIYDLARNVSLFSGCAPGRDLKIEFIGLRKGEKMNEELWEQWERPVATTHKKILAIREPHPLSQGILDRVQHLEACLVANEKGASLAYLHHLFPDFLPNRTQNGLRPREAEIAGVNFKMGEVL